MWRSRGKSTVLLRKNSSDFSLSSFKDIQQLCADENSDPQHPQPSSSSSNKVSTVFHRVRLANSFPRSFSAPFYPPQPQPQSEPTHRHFSESNASPSPSPSPAPSSTGNAVEQPKPSISLPGAETRIVVYFTSLRVVRSTFEDCRAVQSILRGFRVFIDERDLSIDSAFLEELQRILGQPEKTKLALPRVFIGGRYIGGAEEIMQLHEAGELKKYVEGLPPAEPGTCEVCGGYRFILCDGCSGSHKCYTEKAGFRSCTACNENGLIRCPACSCTPF